MFEALRRSSEVCFRILIFDYYITGAVWFSHYCKIVAV